MVDTETLLLELLREADFDGGCDVCKERWAEKLDKHFGTKLLAEIQKPEPLYTGSGKGMDLSQIDNIFTAKYLEPIRASFDQPNSLFTKLK